jgi:mannose-6-phosphate isomerase-like protein (cupin superfamily)
MKRSNLKEMKRGWFIGDFEPQVWKTKEFEVGVQRYKVGDSESEHVHKIATEINAVIFGTIQMNDEVFTENEIAIIEPGEYVKFKSITDSVLAVIKVPSIIGDKYLK